MSSLSAIFSPPPDAITRVLDDLTNPDLTLRDIALAHNTTIDALTTWVARPDIEQRFAAAESMAARRIRFVATSNLSVAVSTVVKILNHFNADLPNLPGATSPNQTGTNNATPIPSESAPAAPRPDLAALEVRRRYLEHGRKAATLLIRLARFNSHPLPAGGGRGVGERTSRPPAVQSAPATISHSNRAAHEATRAATADALLSTLASQSSEATRRAPSSTPATPAEPRIATALHIPTAIEVPAILATSTRFNRTNLPEPDTRRAPGNSPSPPRHGHRSVAAILAAAGIPSGP